MSAKLEAAQAKVAALVEKAVMGQARQEQAQQQTKAADIVADRWLKLRQKHDDETALAVVKATAELIEGKKGEPLPAPPEPPLGESTLLKETAVKIGDSLLTSLVAVRETFVHEHGVLEAQQTDVGRTAKLLRDAAARLPSNQDLTKAIAILKEATRQIPVAVKNAAAALPQSLNNKAIVDGIIAALDARRPPITLTINRDGDGDMKSITVDLHDDKKPYELKVVRDKDGNMVELEAKR